MVMAALSFGAVVIYHFETGVERKMKFSLIATFVFITINLIPIAMLWSEIDTAKTTVHDRASNIHQV